METVTFARLTTFTGRNGTFKAAGVELIGYDHRKVVQVSPITSKGTVGRCDIDIPVEDIPALIAALQKFAVPAPDINAEIAKAEKGDQEALGFLYHYVQDASHGPNCSYRNKGECDCIKADIAQVLQDQHFGEPE